jgi:maleate isomerase
VRDAIRRSPLAPSFDARAIEKRAGLVLLGTDHTSEADFGRMVASERVGVFSTRIEYANPVTPENLRAMQPRLEAAARLILPDEDLDVICFSCSSASVVIGDEAVETAIRAAKPNAAVVTPPLASVAALEALGARRISVLTPYTADTSAPMADYFEAKGFEIDRFTCLGLDDDRQMARITPSFLIEAAAEAMRTSSDALFISCTALRVAQVVTETERRIERPVVTSNQSTAWACLLHCGIRPNHEHFGRLASVTGAALR